MYSTLQYLLINATLSLGIYKTFVLIDIPQFNPLKIIEFSRDIL